MRVEAAEKASAAFGKDGYLTEHLIRDAEDLDQHVDYIHFNPVKHGLVDDPDEWPYSTWHHWKKEFARPINIPPQDWSTLSISASVDGALRLQLNAP